MNNSNNKNLKIVLVLIIVLCFICVLVLSVLGFLIYGSPRVYTNNNVNSTQETVNSTSINSTSNTTSDSTQENVEQNATKIFVGEFVTATIPTDWSIIEYSDENGMSAFVDTGDVTFSGLTGLEILDGDSNIVFSLKGIDGVGGAGGCLSLAKFADTQLSYIQSVQQETDALGFGSTTIVDLTSSDYVEIETLNHRFRRVDNILYFAKDYSMHFNTACGIDAQFIKLDELSFTIQDGSNAPYSANAYKYGISSNVNSSSTLEKLDAVLVSLKSKSAS